MFEEEDLEKLKKLLEELTPKENTNSETVKIKIIGGKYVKGDKR